MTPLEAGAVLLGGIAAGGINVVVGSGTLITFPLLLGVGFAPVAANVSNTVGLVPGSLIGAWGYRAELEDHRRRLIRLLAASTSGGLLGAVLLLTLPPGAFKTIVPAFIVVALVLVLVQPRLAGALAQRRGGAPTGTGVVLAALFVCGIYGGYFGAAQGIVILAVLGFLTHQSLHHANGIKNVLAGATNLVAGVVFALTTEVDWAAAALIAVGAAIGGYGGARVGRRLPPHVLRGLIVFVGCIAVVRLVV